MSNQAVKILMFDHSHDYFELQGLPAKDISADFGLLVFQKLIIIFTCILHFLGLNLRKTIIYDFFLQQWNINGILYNKTLSKMSIILIENLTVHIVM